MLLHGTPFLYLIRDMGGGGGMGFTKGAEPVLWTPIANELLIVIKKINCMGNKHDKERFAYLEFRAHTKYVY